MFKSIAQKAGSRCRRKQYQDELAVEDVEAELAVEAGSMKSWETGLLLSAARMELTQSAQKGLVYLYPEYC